MSTDTPLVERLRRDGEHVKVGPNWWAMQFYPAICKEAADEIERLEAALAAAQAERPPTQEPTAAPTPKG